MMWRAVDGRLTAPFGTDGRFWAPGLRGTGVRDIALAMDTDLHFISGLPRSGSTLLSALLRQNPRFHAGISGPVSTLVETMLKAASMANETSLFIDDEQRERLLRGIFETFHGVWPAGDVAFDTSRLWCAKLPLLHRLYPAARVICCVRDVASIVDSLERLVQRNPLQPSGIFGFEGGGTLYSRVEGIGGGTGLVGFAWNALREAFYGPHTDRLLLVTYDTLTRNPQRAMAAIYQAIGQPLFQHDFGKVEFDATEFDRRLGTPGLHEVKREVRTATPRQSVLPPDLIRKYAADNFWLDHDANIYGVQIV